MSGHGDPPAPLRVRGVVLPDGGPPRELWLADGRVSTEPVPGAVTLAEEGYLVPGLVDAHCHIGLGARGGVELDEAVSQAETDRDHGTLLVRDCGVPIDTTPLQQRDDLPEIIRAGRHIAKPKRYIPNYATELENESELPAMVAEQALRGDGWVKLVGDWIERERGDLAPLWSDKVLAEAVDTAHAHGARVTAHVFGEEAIPGLLRAGIDCLEHATGISDDWIDQMANSGTALVPTLINIATFPEFAAAGERKFPTYAAHMRRLHAGVDRTIGHAVEAGVPVYAGTDAGGGIEHGRLVDELEELHRIGMTTETALGAGSWAARGWLRRPLIEHGAPANFLVCAEDPRRDLGVLRAPEHIVLRGSVYGRHGRAPAVMG